MADEPRLVPLGDAERAQAAESEPPHVSHLELIPPRRLLAAIVASSDDAILSKDLNGIITSWNAGAERTYGYTAAEAIGRSVSMLVPPDLKDDVPQIMARLRRGERIEHYETQRLTRDGRRLHVSLTISPLHDQAGRIIGASTIARDVTERTLEAARWRLLSHAGQALTGILDPALLLRELAGLLVGETADFCITYLVDGGRIRRIGVAHADPGQSELVGRLVRLPPPSLDDPTGVGALVGTGEPVLTKEIPPELLVQASAGRRDYLEVLRELAPLSCIVLPLRARGQIVGAITLATTARSQRRYDAADLVLGRELAERAALALDNARLYGDAHAELARREAAEESLRRRYDQLRVLYEMTAAVGRAESLEEIYDQALDGLRRGTGFERASILLVDPDGLMRFKAWRGLSEGYRRAVEGHTPWDAAVRDPQPIVVSDVDSEPTFDERLRATLRAEGFHALAFVPLVFGDRLLGKLMLYADAARTFADDELELARSIAGTIAFAITRMRDEQSVREAKEAAERANEAKSQFLSIMSHELRTPLNAVLGYAELLLLETKGRINAAQRAQLRRIQISAGHQLELVEELLTYARLEAGREQPRLLETDVSRVLRDVHELVKPEADLKRLKLAVEVEAVPLVLLTDPAKLRQIVLNLAGNATKYTQEGSVTLRAHPNRKGVVVQVSDTGPGIAGDKLEYIFEPFARVDETLTRGTAGSGLGLAIARRLAHLLGGELRVTSRLGEGSTFTLELPDCSHLVSS